MSLKLFFTSHKQLKQKFWMHLPVWVQIYKTYAALVIVNRAHVNQAADLHQYAAAALKIECNKADPVLAWQSCILGDFPLGPSTLDGCNITFWWTPTGPLIQLPPPPISPTVSLISHFNISPNAIIDQLCKGDVDRTWLKYITCFTKIQ